MAAAPLASYSLCKWGGMVQSGVHHHPLCDVLQSDHADQPALANHGQGRAVVLAQQLVGFFEFLVLSHEWAISAHDAADARLRTAFGQGFDQIIARQYAYDL